VDVKGLYFPFPSFSLNVAFFLFVPSHHSRVLKAFGLFCHQLFRQPATAVQQKKERLPKLVTFPNHPKSPVSACLGLAILR
jgi:hypothetical protein